MGDFASCRFDFRLDAKNGLMPSKRKKSERIPPSNYSTLFKCKQCGALFSTRALLLDHKLIHTEHKCMVCAKTFSKRIQLREHMKTPHPTKIDPSVSMTEQNILDWKTQSERHGDDITPDNIDCNEFPQSGKIDSQYTSKSYSIQGISHNSLPVWVSSNNGAETLYQSEAISPSTLSSLAKHIKSEPDDCDDIAVENIPQQFRDYIDYLQKTVLSNQVEFSTFYNSYCGFDTSHMVAPTTSDTSVKQELKNDDHTFKIRSITKNASQVMDCSKALDFSLKSPDNFQNKNLETLTSSLAFQDVIDLSCKSKENFHHNFKDKCEDENCAKQKTIELKDVKQEFLEREGKSWTTLHNMDSSSEYNFERSEENTRTMNLCSNTNFAPESRQNKRSKGLTKMVEKLWKNKMLENSEFGSSEECSKVSEATDSLMRKKDEGNQATEDNHVTNHDPSSNQSCGSDQIFEVISECNEMVFQQDSNVSAEILEHLKKTEMKCNEIVFQQHCKVSAEILERLEKSESETNAIDLRVQVEKKDAEELNSSRFSKLGKSDDAMRNVIETRDHKSLQTFSPGKIQVCLDSLEPRQFHTCPVCSRPFSDTDTLWEHVHTHDMNNLDCFKHNLGSPLSLPGLPTFADTVSEDGEFEEMESNNNVKTEDCNASTWKDVFRCDFPGCGIICKEWQHLRVHSSLHFGQKSISCYLCRYSCRHRSSMNWHMKSKHGLEKSKSEGNRTVYVNTYGSINDLNIGPLKEFQNEQKEKYPSCETNINESFNHLRENLLNKDVKQKEAMVVENKTGIFLNKHTRSEHQRSLRAGAHPDQQVLVKNQPSNLGTRDKMSQNKSEPQLLLTKVTPAPGKHPQFFTSLMRIKYPKRMSKAARNRQCAKRERSRDTGMADAYSFGTTRKEMINDAGKIWTKEAADENASSFHCGFCAFKAASKDELKNHATLLHKNTTTECDDHLCLICGKGYSSKILLTHHLQKHKDVRPQFDCPYENCTLKFHSKGAQKLHTHRFHAMTSQPKANSEQELDSDSSAQTGERPLVCFYPGCDKAFRELKHLKVHQMQHTDEKPLRCELCEYSCRQRNSMNWHMKSKHGQEKHVTQDGRTIYV